MTLGAGDDMASGKGGQDTLVGNSDNDALFGEEGDDLLRGGSGDDTLFGGAASNVLVGGKGADNFIFSNMRIRDTIRDFEHGTDHLTFRATLGINSVADAMDHASQSSNNVVFDFGAGNQLTVKGVILVEISDDPIFA